MVAATLKERTSKTRLRRFYVLTNTKTGAKSSTSGLDVVLTDGYRQEGQDLSSLWRKYISLGLEATGGLQTIFSESHPCSNLRAFVRFKTGQFDNPPNTVIEHAIEGDIATSSGEGTQPTLSLGVAQRSAKRALVQKLNKVRRQFQGGVFLGELREAVHMVRHPLKSLREGLTSYARTAKKRARRSRSEKQRNRTVQDTWLEYQFGFKPLASDIEDAAHALSQSVHRFSTQTRVSAVGRTEGNTSKSAGSITYPTGALSIDWKIISHETGFAYYVAGVNGGPEGKPPPLTQTWGFHTADFLPTVWELIPYSFLVDYFTNVGDIIDAASQCLVAPAWISATEGGFRHESLSITMPSRQATYGNDFRDEGLTWQPATRRCGYVRRDSITSASLIPPLSFRLPGTGTKWLNIAALANLRTIK